METWSQVILEWVNCLELLDAPIRSFEELHDGNFYEKLISLLSCKNKNYLVNEDFIYEFIREEYPDFLVGDHISHTLEDVYITSLLLLRTSQEHQFQRPMCLKLQLETQIKIKIFLEYVLRYGKDLTVDVLKMAISELADETPKTPPATPKIRPLKRFFDSPVARSARNNRLASEHSREIRRLESALDSERFEKFDLQDHLNAERKKVQNLERRYNDKSRELEALREELRSKPPTPCSSTKKQNARETIERYRKEIKSLEEYSASLRAEVDNLTDENENLTKNLASSTRQFSSLKEKFERTELSLETLSIRAELKERELLELGLQNQELRSHLQEIRKASVGEQSFEVDAVVADSSLRLPNDGETLSSVIDIQLQEAREEAGVLRTRLEGMSRQLESADCAVIEYKDRIKTLEKTIERVETENSQLKSNIEYATRTTKEFMNQIAHLSMAHNLELDNLTIGELSSQFEDLITSLESANDCKKTEIKELDVKLVKANTKISTLQDAIRSIKKKNEENILEQAKLLEALKISDVKIKNFEIAKLEYSATVNSLQEKIEDLNNKNSCLHSDIQNIAVDTKEFMMKIARLSMKNDLELNNCLPTELSAQFADLISSLESMNDSKEKEIKQLDIKLKDVNTIISMLEENIKRMEKKDQENTLELIKMSDRLQDSAEKIKEQEEKVLQYSIERANNLKEFNVERESLTNNIKKLECDLCDRKAIVESLTLRVKDLENEKDALLEEFESSKQISSQEFMEYQARSSKSIQTLSEKCENLQKELEELSLERKNLHTEITTKDENLRIAQEKNVELETLVSEKMETNNELHMTVLSLQNELERLNVRVEQLESEKKSLEDRFKMTNIETDKLIESLKLRISGLSMDLTSLLEEKDSLQRKLSTTLEKMRSEGERNEALLSEREHHRIENERLLEQQRQWELQMKEIVVNLQEIRASRDAVLEAQAVALKESNRQLEELQKEFQVTKAALEYELEQEKLSKTETERMYNDLQIKCTNLETRCIDFENKCINLETECGDLQNTCKDLENKCDGLKNNLSDTKNKCTMLENMCSDMNRKCVDLENNSDVLKKNCKDFEAKCTSLENKCSDLENTCTDLENKCDVLKKNLSDTKNKCTMLENKCSDMDRKCVDLENTSDDLKKNCKDFETKCINLESKCSDLENIRRDLENKCDSLKNNLSDTTNKCTMLENKYSDMGKKCVDLENKSSELKKNCKDFETKCTSLESKCSDLENTCRDLENKCDVLKNNLSDTKNKCTMLENKCSDMENTCRDLENKCDDLKNNLSDTKNKCTMLENKCSDMDKKCVDLENKSSELKKNCKDFETKCTNLENNCTDMENKYTDLEQKYTDLTKKCCGFENRITDDASKLQKLEDNLINEKLELETIKECCKNLIQRKESLWELISKVITLRNLLNSDVKSIKEYWIEVLEKFQYFWTNDSSICDESKHLRIKKEELQKKLLDINREYLDCLLPVMDITWESFLWTEKNLQTSFLAPRSDSGEDPDTKECQQGIKNMNLNNAQSSLAVQMEKFNSLRNDVATVRKEIENFENSASSYETNLKIIQEEAKLKEKQLLDKSSKEKKELKEKLDLFRTRNIKLEKNLDDLRNEIKKLKGERSSDEVKKEFTNHIESLQDDIRRLQLERDELNKRPKEEDFDKRLKDVHEEYGQKLEKIKLKMKAAYNEQVEKLNREQDKTLQEKLESMQIKMTEQYRKHSEEIEKYKKHVTDMTNKYWDVSEKFLNEKHEKEAALKKLQEYKTTSKSDNFTQPYSHDQIAAMAKNRTSSLDRKDFANDSLEGSSKRASRTVQVIEEETTYARRRNVRSIQTMGNAFKAEDEEGEIFNNVYLADMKQGRNLPSADPDRLSILQQRNALCKPHLKSSYPAETQFHSTIFSEEDIKHGLGADDVFNDSLSQSLLPGQKAKKRDRTQTSYKRPGPPTPSKNGGRLSLQGNELFSPKSRILRERNIERRTTTTPRTLKDLFSSSSSRRKDENVTGTPRARRLSIFRKNSKPTNEKN